MHVDTTIEHGGGIFADTAVDHSTSSRVIVDEVRNIMHDASDSN